MKTPKTAIIENAQVDEEDIEESMAELPIVV